MITDDSAHAPEKQEPSDAPAPLPRGERRAIEAAVAGAAGLLLGRVLLGRAGGLVAGIAGVAAGLLAKRGPQVTATREPSPLADKERLLSGEASAQSLPEEEEVSNGYLPAGDFSMPQLESERQGEDEWAASFAEAGAEVAPALEALATESVDAAPEPEAEVPEVHSFMGGSDDLEVSDFSPADTSLADKTEHDFQSAFLPSPERAAIVPEDTPAINASAAAIQPGDIVRDLTELPPWDFPMEAREPNASAPVEGPAAEAVAPPAPMTLSDARVKVQVMSPAGDSAREERVSVEHPFVLGAMDELPAEFAALREEPEPGPREDFLVIPEQFASYPPSIEPMVSALSETFPLPVTPASTSADSTAPDAPRAPVPTAISPFASPFLIWDTASAPPPFRTPAAPAPTEVAATPVPVENVSSSGSITDIKDAGMPPVAAPSAFKTPPPGFAVPAPEPEEIWRQAADELAALRKAPVPLLAPSLLSAPVEAPAPPAFPPLAPTMEGPPRTGVSPQGAANPVPKDIPPWLRGAPEGEPPQEDRDEPPPSSTPILPTARRAVPQELQLPKGRRPFSFPESPADPPETPSSTPATIALQSSGSPPSSIPSAAKSSDPLLERNAPVASPAAPPLFGAASLSTSAAGEEKIFLPRADRRSVTEPPKKRLLTPFRLVLLAFVIAGIAAIFFRSQLEAFWEQTIQGKPPRKQPQPAAEPATPAKSGDGLGVVIVPARTAESTPGGKPVPPSAERIIPSSAPRIVPNPVTPPAPAPSPAVPVPVTEAGARELISHLLRATTPAEVKLYIHDAARLAPTLPAYFSSGKAVPVLSHSLELERASKVAATGRMSWLFRVITDTVPKGFPLSVDDTPDGLRADWEIMVQCRDGALHTFLSNPSVPPSPFYVSLSRAHVFGDMLAGADAPNFFAFTIASPVLDDIETAAFLPKGSPVAARADKLFEWDINYAPIIELSHKSGRVEITGILRENWRSTPPARINKKR